MVVCHHRHRCRPDRCRRSVGLLAEDATARPRFEPGQPRGGQIAPPLALAFETAGGRQKLQCWNTQGIFRLIQSIPSPKAEPFKRGLAKVGKERLDEIENPELAMGRMQGLCEKKGYPKAWIDKRLRGIAVRQDLTDEWKARGMASSVEFAILPTRSCKAPSI